MEIVACPGCGQVAEVLDRDLWPSTGGPVEHLRLRCIARHHLLLPAPVAEGAGQLASGGAGTGAPETSASRIC